MGTTEQLGDIEVELEQQTKVLKRIAEALEKIAFINKEEEIKEYEEDESSMTDDYASKIFDD